VSEFKRVDNLNEHVLSKRVTEILTAELLSKTGRDDFFVVFLSVCNKKERAKVFHGTGSSLWRDYVPMFSGRVRKFIFGIGKEAVGVR